MTTRRRVTTTNGHPAHYHTARRLATSTEPDDTGHRHHLHPDHHLTSVAGDNDDLHTHHIGATPA